MADHKMTKSVGEHWACAELARRNWAPAMTRDGIERTDVLAVATHLLERPMIEVQVKTARQAGAKTTWLLGTKAQQVAVSLREWFVLVLIPTQDKVPITGYVVPRNHLNAAAWIVHRSWETDPSAKPGTRNTGLDRARVGQSVWAPYEGRWDLLDLPTDQVPVLLPSWVKDHSERAEVGLPPQHPWRTTPPTWE